MKTTIMLGFFCFLFCVFDLSEGISPPAPPPVADNDDHVIIENTNIAESDNEDIAAEVEHSEADSDENSKENSEADSDENSDENSEENSDEDSGEDSNEDSEEDSDEDSNLYYTNE